MTALLLTVIALLLVCGYVLCWEHKTDRARLVAVHREELARVADDAAFATEQWMRATADNDRLRLLVGAQAEENARECRESVLLRTALLEAQAECDELLAALRAPLEIERGAS